MFLLHTILLSQVQVDFTQPLYPVAEDVGNVSVALILTRGDATHDRAIVIAVVLKDNDAVGK